VPKCAHGRTACAQGVPTERSHGPTVARVLAPPLFEPMLASPGEPAGPLLGWVAEPKLDGWRAQVAVDPALPAGVRVTTRRGRIITAEVRGLDALVACGHRFVVDCELVTGDGSMESFYGVGAALARRGRGPAVTLGVFDLLWLEGHATISAPDRDRRRLLEELDLPGVVVVPRFAVEDVCLLLGCCDELGVEGLVLKNGHAPYLPGKRSPSWRKVKVPAWRERHEQKRRPRR
jgi:bifunctional non-homologous end joining protein LigD